MPPDNKYKKLADAVAVLHLVWIVLMAGSVGLVILVEQSRIYVLIVVLMNALNFIIWEDCVLVKWENNLRRRYDKSRVYAGAFTVHYLEKYFKIRVSSFLARNLIYGYAVFIAILLVVGIVL